MLKYPVLRIWSVIAIIFGWIILIIGIISFIAAMLWRPGAHVALSDLYAAAGPYAGPAAAIACVFLGISLVIVGETIKVFLDIEFNTRMTHTDIAALARALKDVPVKERPRDVNEVHEIIPTSPVLVCAKCGAVNSDGAKFCQSCGAAL